jgi:hypothetical protein
MQLDRMSVAQLIAEALELPAHAESPAARPPRRGGCAHSWMSSVDAAFDGGKPARRRPWSVRPGGNSPETR